MTTSPRLVVDTASGIAPWRQVRDQILRHVITGDLPPGSTLPTIRQLARDLGLAAGTVARAYRELEAAGILQTARRRGTHVAAVPTGPDESDPLAAAARDFAARARELGVDVATALAAVHDAYDE